MISMQEWEIERLKNKKTINIVVLIAVVTFTLLIFPYAFYFSPILLLVVIFAIWNLTRETNEISRQIDDSTSNLMSYQDWMNMAAQPPQTSMYLATPQRQETEDRDMVFTAKPAKKRNPIFTDVYGKVWNWDEMSEEEKTQVFTELIDYKKKRGEWGESKNRTDIT